MAAKFDACAGICGSGKGIPSEDLKESTEGKVAVVVVGGLDVEHGGSIG